MIRWWISKEIFVLAKKEIAKSPPKLFISGHSHILKVMYDQHYNLLHLNPGACGKVGWHKVRTMMRFYIDGEQIKDLEVIELGKKYKKRNRVSVLDIEDFQRHCPFRKRNKSQ